MSVDVMDPDPGDEEEPEEEPIQILDEVTKKPRRRNAVESRQFAREIWQEYFSGMTQAEISRMHGVPLMTINSHLKKFARTYGKRELERARRTDLERIEALMDAQWKKAVASGKPEAVKLVLTMIKLRADVFGYAAAKKVEHSGETLIGVTPELADLVRQVQERNQAVRADLERVAAGELTGPVIDGEIVDEPDDHGD